jgi:F-type H+-transporting ATPase subunit gamma
MANLKEVRDRIVSVSSTQQITSAMKMVSAAKLKRAQNAITKLRPYANKLKEILENVTANLDSETNSPLAENREINRVLIVAINSNRGLCGAFNANVVKKAKLVATTDFQNQKVSVISIGKKALDAFKKTEYGIVGKDVPKDFNYIYDDLSFDKTALIAEKLMELFLSKEFDKVVLVYNQFKNAAVQEVVAEQFLPLLPVKVSKTNSTKEYIFEPNVEYIVEDLIPKSLKTQLYKALLDSFASEHGARMTSMHKATDNAKDMLKNLKLSYNKARQAAITNEILEIVGGAQALNN